MTTALVLAAAVVIVLLNAFFVAAEYALVTARRGRMEELEGAGDRRAGRVMALQADPGAVIADVRLAVTFAGLALGALVVPAVAGLIPGGWGDLAAAAAAAGAFLLVGYIHAVLGEIVPKAFTLEHAERTALAVATPMRVFHVLLRPFRAVLATLARHTLRRLGLPETARSRIAHSEEELKLLVAASREEGVLEEEEQEMLHKVFEFADKDAAQVMVPRPDVTALALDTPVTELLRIMLDHPYTRYPVYEGDLDSVEGVLHVRDLFAALHDRGIDGVEVRDLLRPAIMVPETKPLDELLAEFRATRTHMAIVVDEYGSLAGLVTLEDLLEEIVGEIGDEFDRPDTAIRRIGLGRLRIAGSFPIDEFNDRFGTHLPGDDYHSVGGFVFGELGRAPKVGDVVSADGAQFEVSALDGPRITEVDVRLAAERQLPPAVGEA